MDKPFKIQLLNQISAVGLKRLPAERYVTGKAISDPDAIMVRSQDMHAMTIPASVRAVGRAGAGTNNIPVKALSERGVPVFNAPGANANAVKELVLAGMLMASRNLARRYALPTRWPAPARSLSARSRKARRNSPASSWPATPWA
ncbi:MAG: hypothetical protein ACKVQQ_18510 [Burkholderiales bacterium]